MSIGFRLQSGSRQGNPLLAILINLTLEKTLSMNRDENNTSLISLMFWYCGWFNNSEEKIKATLFYQDPI